MRRIKKVLPFMLLIASTFSLVLITNIYFSYQKSILVESNGLLGLEHIKLDQLDQTAKIEKDLASSSYWKMLHIEKSEKKNIFSFYSNHYDRVNIPLKNGRMFSNKNTKEAIVGTKIDTFFSNDKEWITYEKKNYEVIGRVGIVPNSSVSKYILLNDSDINDEHGSVGVF